MKWGQGGVSDLLMTICCLALCKVMFWRWHSAKWNGLKAYFTMSDHRQYLLGVHGKSSPAMLHVAEKHQPSGHWGPLQFKLTAHVTLRLHLSAKQLQSDARLRQDILLTNFSGERQSAILSVKYFLTTILQYKFKYNHLATLQSLTKVSYLHAHQRNLNSALITDISSFW